MIQVLVMFLPMQFCERAVSCRDGLGIELAVEDQLLGTLMGSMNY